MLREKVAIRRLQNLQGAGAGSSESEPPAFPNEDADPDVPVRGQKRPTSEDRSSPSKRPAL